MLFHHSDVFALGVVIIILEACLLAYCVFNIFVDVLGCSSEGFEDQLGHILLKCIDHIFVH